MASLTAVDYDPFVENVPRITVTPNRPTVPDVARPLLRAIAGSESPDYNVVHGGGTFGDFSDHPRRAVPITSGPNAGRTSSAAGLYQFLAPTWDEVQRETGLPDFSPESQDYGAWHLASKTYKKKTGRDLEKDLTNVNGNPHAIAGIGRVLSGVWTSLPGGIEPNSMTSSFATRYDDGSRTPTEMSAQRKLTAVDYDPFADAPPATAGAGRPSDVQPSVSADTGGRFTDTAGENFRVAREGVSETAPPKTSAVTALGRGAATGLTANFYDELVGLAAAGGRTKDDEPLGLGQVLLGAYRRLTSDPEAKKAFDAAVEKEREATKRAETDQPVASIAGNVLGAVALPVGSALQAPTVAGRAVRSAAVGAGFGAAAGAGEGEGAADRLSRAATGGLMGGAIGGAASPVLDLAARGASRVAQEAGRYLFPNVEQRAAQMVQNAAQSAQRVDPGARTRLTPAEAAATPQSAVADITGEPGRAIARWAANASPEARETLNAMIDPRFEGQAGRIVGWLNNTFHYPNASAQQEAIEKASKQAVTPAYQKAMANGRVGYLDQELMDLSQAPIMQAAIKGATEKAQNKSAPDVSQGAAAVQQRWANNGKPTLEFWDLVKRQLDQEINVAKRAGRTEDVREAARVKELLVGKLDAAFKDYAPARQTAASFFGAENALEAGQNFVTRKMTADEARRALARMSPTDRQLFQDGYVSGFIQRLNETGDRRNILNQIANSPADRERLSIALGPQRANELEAMLRVEGVMNLFRNQVQGNSTTARQLVELGAVGTYGGVGAYMSDPQTLLQSAIAGAFVARGRNTDQRVAQRVAQMLTSHDPRVFQNGLNAVARSQRLMNNIRGLDQRIARIAGEQSSGVPAIQAGAIGRAQDEQPSVPRPPGQ